MGYTKIISYAGIIELYEYEKDVISLLGRGKQKRKNIACSTDMGTVGEDSLQKKRSMGKRPDNGRRASMAFRRVVASNLDGSAKPLLLTLTYGENFTDLSAGYRHFSTFIQSLRNTYGKSFRYIAVPEFQKRGAVHFHALIWGLPTEVFLLERKTRGIATLWGQGFIYMKETDGNEKLSHYLSKYMAKAFLDPRLKNQKSYVASRNIKRPLIQKGSIPADFILEEYGVNQEAVVDKTYPTRFLGKGRYRIFKTNDQS